MRYSASQSGRQSAEKSTSLAAGGPPPVRRRDNFPWAPAGREKFRSRYTEESTLLAAGGPPVRRRDNFPWAPAGHEKFRSRYAEESTLLAAKGAGLKIDFCKSPRLRDFGVLIGFIEGGKGPYEVTALKSTQKWKKYSATRPIIRRDYDLII